MDGRLRRAAMHGCFPRDPARREVQRPRMSQNLGRDIEVGHQLAAHHIEPARDICQIAAFPAGQDPQSGP